jgi:predicted RNase H-like nuclease
VAGVEARHQRREHRPAKADRSYSAGVPLQSRKSSWAGMTFRRQLLGGAGICLPDDLGAAGEKAAPDDVLDAAAAAWTALRVLRNQARPSPNPPELFSDGLPSAIWT